MHALKAGAVALAAALALLPCPVLGQSAVQHSLVQSATFSAATPTVQAIGLRFGYGAIDFGHKLRVSGDEYGTRADVKAFRATLDWYPARSAPARTGPRLSAGTRVGGALAPHVGLGYGGEVLGGMLPISFDLGAVLRGREGRPAMGLAHSGELRVYPVVQVTVGLRF